MIHPRMIFDPMSRGLAVSICFGSLLCIGAFHDIVCHEKADLGLPAQPQTQPRSESSVRVLESFQVEGALHVEPDTARAVGDVPTWRIGQLSPVEVALPDYAQFEQSGLASLVLQEGDSSRGRPDGHSRVSVRMLGWTEDGKPIRDFELLNVSPVTFGVDQVVPGFAQALKLMHPGERRRVWIPQEIGYDGAPNRPQGTMIFDIELVAFRNP